MLSPCRRIKTRVSDACPQMRDFLRILIKYRNLPDCLSGNSGRFRRPSFAEVRREEGTYYWRNASLFVSLFVRDRFIRSAKPALSRIDVTFSCRVREKIAPVSEDEFGTEKLKNSRSCRTRKEFHVACREKSSLNHGGSIRRYRVERAFSVR